MEYGDAIRLMYVLSRSCSYDQDIERIIALLLNYRTAANLHDTSILTLRLGRPKEDGRFPQSGPTPDPPRLPQRLQPGRPSRLGSGRRSVAGRPGSLLD
jgi:hypothetical protein